MDKQLKTKIADYTFFGQVLLALSTFLFIGILLQGAEKSNHQLLAMLLVIFAFAILAFLFFYRVKTLKEKNDR